MKQGLKFYCPALPPAVILPAVGAFLLFFSCSGGPDVYRQIDAGVLTGSYQSALVSLDDENGAARKTVYTSKNEILLYLDRGMIAHYAGFYEESSRDLEAAERLIEEAFTKSISQEIGSYLLNDNTKNYAGEDYEDLYVNVFNSLNYYHNNDLEGALVEIRRLNEKLQYLADKYQQAIEKVKASNKDLDSSRLPVEATRFSNSALARYLGMLFFRGTGRKDDARIDYEELKHAYELAPEVYRNPVPSSIEEENSVPEGMGRLNLIAFTGLSPVKEQRNILIPLPFDFPNNSARIALPAMVGRVQEVKSAEAVLENGETIKLELLEDMGAVASETFKSSYGLIVFKSAARAVGKAAASAALANAAAERQEKEDSFGLGSLVGLLGRAYSEASEQADTRLSRYFPCYALVGGRNLEPGVYNVTVNFYGSGGLVHSQQKEIMVKQNTLNLEEFVCLK